MTANMSNETMIEDVARLYQRVGHLSARVIDDQIGMASAAQYRTRFGGLKVAYNLAGIYDQRPSDEALLQDLVRLHEEVGRLSWRRIARATGVASALTYQHRFGSLGAACALAGI